MNILASSILPSSLRETKFWETWGLWPWAQCSHWSPEREYFFPPMFRSYSQLPSGSTVSELCDSLLSAILVKTMSKFDYFKMKRQESRLEFQIQVYKCVIVKTKNDRSQCVIMRLLKKKKKKKVWWTCFHYQPCNIVCLLSQHVVVVIYSITSSSFTASHGNQGSTMGIPKLSRLLNC